ncbi:uncharacterized protein [Diabrotica undecimpunctata]|uniref:uncharacterized protein n=1 Tax=Diabrotica undecimpunctata TaxID=50387 RepID=UPI003B63C8E2
MSEKTRYPTTASKWGAVILSDFERQFTQDDTYGAFEMDRCSTPKPAEEIPSVENDKPSYQSFCDHLRTRITKARVRGIVQSPKSIIGGHLVGARRSYDADSSDNYQFIITTKTSSPRRPQDCAVFIWNKITATLRKLHLDEDQKRWQLK